MGYRKHADLSPPLGYPGGPCHVVRRIMEEVSNPSLRDELVEDVEHGLKLNNSQTAKIYDIDKERGKGAIRQLWITRHAQYRMDQRGITVNEIRLALDNFSKVFQRGAELSGQTVRKQSLVKIQSLFSDWAYDAKRGEPLSWTDPQIGLTVIFKLGRNLAEVITTYWKNHPDPRATECPGTRTAYSPPTSQLPGVQTYVTETSKKELPPNTSKPVKDNYQKRQLGPSAPEHKDQALPITPKFEKQRDRSKLNGPNQPQFNAPPGSDKALGGKPLSTKRVRTPGTPGQEYGHPVIEQGYRLHQRRPNILAAEVERGMVRRIALRSIVGGYAPGKPYLPQGRKKQRKQKGKARKYYRINYLRTRATVRPKNKIRYKKLRPKARFKRYKRLSRQKPERVQRRPGGGTMDPKDRTKKWRKDNPGKYREYEKSRRDQIKSEKPKAPPSDFMKKDDKPKKDKYEGFAMSASVQAVVLAFYRVQESPGNLPQNWVKPKDTGTPEGETDDTDINAPPPYEGLSTWVRPDGQKTPKKIPAEKPRQPHVINAPGSAKVIPWNSGMVNNSDYNSVTQTFASMQKTAVQIASIEQRCGKTLHNRAKEINFKKFRVDQKNNMWLFNVTGSSGGSYRVRVKINPKTAVLRDVSKMDVQVSCSCDFWRWQGPEYWARKEGYLYGRPRGAATQPAVRDPNHWNGACKHVLAVFTKVKNYRTRTRRKLGSEDNPHYLADTLSMGRVLLKYSSFDEMLESVVKKYLRGPV